MAKRQKDVKDETSNKGKCNTHAKVNNKRKGKKHRDGAENMPNNNEVIHDFDTRKKGSLEVGDRDNNPNWYFLDPSLADQVSALSFQQLAGLNIILNGVSYDVPNILKIPVLPSPGVQVTVGSPVQQSAINLAAFRIFSKLSAFTGRVATYGPQDIAMMILAMGEIISQIEWARRGFGLAYQMNMRNRSYPRAVLQSMCIDADDLFNNYSDYRTKFNTIVTMVNQIPIPLNIAYFDKCASLYEKVYLDSPSDMAQTIYLQPLWSWVLDETSYSGGTKLASIPWDHDLSGAPTTATTMGTWLNTIMYNVRTLLNSSSLQTVYTDLLNLATKLNVPFWHFDYLLDGYTVVPEYDENFMLQFHNMTTAGLPTVLTNETQLANGISPYNDVYPDPNSNQIVYNPVFRSLVGSNGNSASCCNNETIIDMFTDHPTVEDRVEVTRFVTSHDNTSTVQYGSLYGRHNFALPDHFVVFFVLYNTNNATAYLYTNGNSSIGWPTTIASMSQITHCPRFNKVDDTTGAQIVPGVDFGDLNFYTSVNCNYLRKLHDFVGLALYDLR